MNPNKISRFSSVCICEYSQILILGKGKVPHKVWPDNLEQLKFIGDWEKQTKNNSYLYLIRNSNNINSFKSYFVEYKNQKIKKKMMDQKKNLAHLASQ